MMGNWIEKRSEKSKDFKSYLVIEMRSYLTGHTDRKFTMDTNGSTCDTCILKDSAGCDVCHLAYTVAIKVYVPSEISGQKNEMRTLEFRKFDNYDEANACYQYFTA